MKLVVVVADSHDADPLETALVEAGLPVTSMGSTGGFLRRRSTTLVLGVQDDEVDAAIDLVRRLSEVRMELMPARRLPFLGAAADVPIEVRRGGAVVWVLPVERFEKV